MTTTQAQWRTSPPMSHRMANRFVDVRRWVVEAIVAIRIGLLFLSGALVLAACGAATDPETSRAAARAATAREAAVTGVNAVTTGRYVRLEADTEVNGNAWTSVAEFNVLDASGSVIPRAGWIASADSQETVGESGYATNAIDGDPNTFWHTQWYGANPAHPHALTVDMQVAHDVGGFRYLPRQVGVNGRIADWRFYTSTDGNSWTLVSTGTFPNSSAEATVTFAAATSAPNRPPTLNAVANRSDTAGQSVTQALSAADPDGDPLTFAAATLPTGLIIDGSTGLMSGVPTVPGVYTVNVQVSDGKGGSASTSFAWTIAAAPAPIAPTTPTSPTASGGPVVARYVALEATAEVNGNPWTSVADFNLLDANGLRIARNGWTAAADSQETVAESGYATNAIDGDPNTFWHTQWYGNSPTPPHRLTVDLGTTQSITAFKYLPRQLGVNGRIASWRFYASTDGVAWTLISSGNFPNTADEQSVVIASATTPTTPAAPTTPTTPITPVTPTTPSTPTTPVNQPPVVSTPTHRNDTVGQSVSQSLTASDPDGDALAYAASNLPGGTSIDAHTGVITGTLSAAGMFNTTVQVSDGKGGIASASFAWTVSSVTPPASPNATRAARIAAFASGPLVAGSPWTASESVTYDSVRRLSSGQHVVYTTPGTTGSSEPGQTSTILDGRPIADGNATAYLTGRTLTATQVGAPIVSSAASATMAGLIETDFAAGDYQLPRYAAVEGCRSLSTGTSFIGHYCYANGPASGSGNATSVASGQYGAGLSNAYVYHANTWSEEFAVTDRMFGLVFANSSSAVNVEVDGVPVQAGRASVPARPAGRSCSTIRAWSHVASSGSSAPSGPWRPSCAGSA